MGVLVQEKIARLRGLLSDMGSVLVSFSGGVDSTFLLRVAYEVLGNKVLAVTVASEVHPEWELQEAREEASRMGLAHEVVPAKVLDIPGFTDNPPERCYLCKRSLFSMLKRIASERGIPFVVDGTNKDDEGDYRPGLMALKELGIRSPLREAGLTKDDIRSALKAMGCSTWNKPALACLATRFPYGVKLTKEKLRRVEAGEGFLRGLGIHEVRLRDHGDIARIETNEAGRKICLMETGNISTHLRELGYTYITLDLEGYRTGSMNAGLTGGQGTRAHR